MLNMTENRAKEILDFLIKRYSKRLDIAAYIDSNRKYVKYDGYFLDFETTTSCGHIIIQYYYNDCWPVTIFIRPFDNAGKRINFNINTKQISIKKILDMFLNVCSKGYAIESYNYTIESYNSKQHVVFMSPYETLEQIFIEKDLEV